MWRPLIFEFPEDSRFLAEDVQFLLGDSILISPIVYEGANSIDAKFPAGIWYDWKDGTAISGPTTQTLQANLTEIPIHVRAGSIIPLKSPKLTISDTYNTPFGLLVALDKNGTASGRLYIDDGHSIEQGTTTNINFSFSHGTLAAKGQFDYQESTKLEKISVLGGNFTMALVNDKKYHIQKDGKTGASVAQGFQIDLTSSFTVQFK